MCKVIGIVSLKGGVGKTSTVASLGHAFSKIGKRTLLVDGNLSAPNLGMHLDIVDPKIGLHEVLSRSVNPSDAIHSLDNFDVIPSKIFGGSFNPEFFSLKKRLGFLKQKYDIILIDSSPRLDDETLAVMMASDEIIVVTTPDLPTLGTTMKAVKLAKSRGTPISGLVLNKVYSKNFEIPLKHVEETLGLPVMAVVPHDVSAVRAVSEFKPLTELKPKSKASEEYMRLAASLVGEKYKPLKLGNLFRWASPKKQDINRTIYYQSVFSG